eukprot:8811533-Lingulodinium_polyedra.AAC.1
MLEGLRRVPPRAFRAARSGRNCVVLGIRGGQGVVGRTNRRRGWPSSNIDVARSSYANIVGNVVFQTLRGWTAVGLAAG